MSSEDYQPRILLLPFKRPLRTHKFSASGLKHRICMCLLFSYPMVFSWKKTLLLLFLLVIKWCANDHPLGFFMLFFFQTSTVTVILLQNCELSELLLRNLIFMFLFVCLFLVFLFWVEVDWLGEVSSPIISSFRSLCSAFTM